MRAIIAAAADSTTLGLACLLHTNSGYFLLLLPCALQVFTEVTFIATSQKTTPFSPDSCTSEIRGVLQLGLRPVLGWLLPPVAYLVPDSRQTFQLQLNIRMDLGNSAPVVESISGQSAAASANQVSLCKAVSGVFACSKKGTSIAEILFKQKLSAMQGLHALKAFQCMECSPSQWRTTSMACISVTTCGSWKAFHILI